MSKHSRLHLLRSRRVFALSACLGLAAAARLPAADLVVQGANSPYNYTTGTASYDNVYVGQSANGTFNQTSGTLNVTTGQLFLGFNAGVTGIYILTGGTLNTSSTDVGDNGTGVFTLSGGAHNVTGTGNGDNGSLDIGFGSSSNGTYNLNGGTLTAGYVRGNSGTSTFNFNGGTLATGTNAATDFFYGLTRANVQAGGARINTANTGVTIAQALVSGTASGTTDGGLTKLGANTLVLLGNNTYTGVTTFAAGAINVANAGALGSTGTLSFTGGTLRYSNGFDITGGSAVTTDYSARFSQAANQAYSVDTNGNRAAVTFATALTSNGGSLTKQGNGTLILLANNTYTGATTIEGGNLQVGNGGTTGSLGTGAVTDNGRLNYNRADNLTLAFAISGSGGLNQIGTGTLTLSGANTYTGPTSILAGTLAVTGSIQSGTLSSLTVDGAGTGPANGTLSSTGSLGVNITYVGYSGPGTFTQSGGTFNTTGGFYLGYSSGSSGTFTLNSGSLTTGPTFVGYQGAGTFTQNGGIVTVSGGTNPFYIGSNSGSSGTYMLNGGNLSTAGVSLGSGGTGTFTQSGGTFTTNSSALGVNGNGTYTLSGTGSLTTGTTTVNSGGTFTQSGGTFNASTLADSGTYTLSAGTLTTGTTQVNENANSIVFTQSGGTHNTGTLRLTGQGATLTGTYALNGGTLKAGTVTGDGSTSGAGKSIFNFNGGTLQAGASATDSFGNLTTANVQAGGAKIDTQSYNVTVAQPLLHDTTSGAPATDGGLTKQQGDGTLTLSGANTYTGPTTVNAGTLQAGVASVAGTSGAFGLNSAVRLANTGRTTLDLNGFNTQIGSLTGGGGAGGNVLLGGATLTVGTDNTSPAAYAGVISEAGNLIKTGTGTLTLTGLNTFTGSTTVSAGTLSVSRDESLGATANPVTVLSGASLLFTGSGPTTRRTFNLANGTIAPAAGGGTLTYAGATVNGGVLGAGTQILADGTALNGVRTTTGTVLIQSGTVAFSNVTLGGSSTFTQGGGATLNSTGDLLTTPQTTVTVSGTVNAAGGDVSGALTINNGGTVNVNGGSSAPLYLDGSRGMTVNAGGKLNAASGSTIELGGLLINNGTQSGTLNVNLGGVARGTGTFGTVNVGQGGYFGPNALATGGAVATNGLPVIRLTGTDALVQTALVGPQLSATPGTANVLSLSLGSGSVFALSIQDAQGAAGSGYDTAHATGTLTLSAGTVAGSRITVSVASLNSGGTAGMASNFDPTRNYSFVLVSADGGISGYNPTEFVVDTNSFQNNTNGGSFSVVQQGNNLNLLFTSAVPEPSTWTMIGLSVLGAGVVMLRRRTVHV